MSERSIYFKGMVSGAILGISLGAITMMAIYDTPEKKAAHDVARCMEVARIMMEKWGIQEDGTDKVQTNMAASCLWGSH